jgi:hypothetical protein
MAEVPRPRAIEEFEDQRRPPQTARWHGRSYSAPFAGRLIEMLESPAYRALSKSGHMVLARLEIEFFAHQGGNPIENGRLIVTHAQFREFGIEKGSVAPALREVEALGFARITEKGVAGNATEAAANKFQLTYYPAGTGPGDGTHEWRMIETPLEANTRAKAARYAKRKNYRPSRGLVPPAVAAE